jgi:hypothetical protein
MSTATSVDKLFDILNAMPEDEIDLDSIAADRVDNAVEKRGTEPGAYFPDTCYKLGLRDGVILQRILTSAKVKGAL